MAETLLKPLGYGLMMQVAESLGDEYADMGSYSILEETVVEI